MIPPNTMCRPPKPAARHQFPQVGGPSAAPAPAGRPAAPPPPGARAPPPRASAPPLIDPPPLRAITPPNPMRRPPKPAAGHQFPQVGGPSGAAALLGPPTWGNWCLAAGFGGL